MEETKSQYLKIIEKSKKVFDDKNSDYGSSWRVLRVSSFLDQIHIKAQRIRNLQINEDQQIDEGQATEFIGIINYCIMSLIQIHQCLFRQSLFHHYWVYRIVLKGLLVWFYRSQFCQPRRQFHHV